MQITRNVLLVAVTFALVVTPALALEVGDPAPALQIREWVKGQPVDLKAGKGKNIYVIEFWATWCKPCLDSIHHMTELQKKYKDQGVIIIGITDERDPAVVKKFVEKTMGDKMDYVVARDERQKTTKAYMGAFGVAGIPQVFVVDREGRLVWYGHPFAGLDQVLADVVAGKFDVEEQRRLARNRRKVTPLLDRYMRLVITSNDAEEARKLSNEFMPLLANDAEMLDGISWQIMINPLVQYRDLELAMRAAELANKLTGGGEPMIMDTYARAFWETGRKQEAVEHQKKAIELTKDERIKAMLEKTLKEYEQKLNG